MRIRSKRSLGFTVLELLLAALLFIGFLGLSIRSYKDYQELVDLMVDQTNQNMLHMAVKMYCYERNALPGTLSELEQEHLERAYALVVKDKQPYTIQDHLLAGIGVQVAYANTLPPLYYFGDINLLTCPRDDHPPSRGGVSYGLNPEAAGKPFVWFKDIRNANVPLILEVADDGQTREFRHLNGTVALETTTGGYALRKYKELME